MNIGFFFKDHETAKKYAQGMYSSRSEWDQSCVFKLRDMKVVYDGGSCHYITLAEFKDCMNIAGMQFDGIFLKDNFSEDIEKFILSRFRPRCVCKGV